jgi:hypothetical protein
MATVFRDVVYGSHPNQRVNLYQPEGYDFITDLGRPLKGVVLWLHGGGWQNGHKDVNKTNFSDYFLPGDLPTIQSLADNNSLDDDACQLLSDLGYFVISANYRLISTGNPYSSVAALNVGGGEYPGSVEDVRELYKYMTFPGYGVGINADTWALVVRYTQTLGLLVLGGSAGGQLAVAGVFEGAGNTGQWPRGLGSVVGPMNLYYDASNPIGATGRDIIARYTNSSETNQKLASPWWKRNSSSDPSAVGYENYLNFSNIADPAVSYNKMRLWIYYNQNDVLVPTNTVEPFVDWARTAMGTDQVSAVKVDVYDPNSLARYRGEWNSGTAYTGGNGILSDVVFYIGRMFKANRSVPVGVAPTDPPDNVNWSYGLDATHNLPPTLSVFNWAQDAAKFVYYTGINTPKLQHRLRPTQGMMFPRVRNNGYRPPPASYTLTAGAASVNEGSTATFTLTTVSVAPNTVLTYTVSGVVAADIVGGATAGPVTTDINGQATISIQMAADLTTEGPETMTVSVRQGGISGTVLASASITVNDTSVNNEILTLSPSTVNLAQTFTTTSTGGQPNTGFSFTWTRNGVLQPALGGSGTLDSSGNVSVPGSLNQSGSYVLRVTYAGSGNVRTANLTVNTESVTIPGSVQAGQVFAISASGAVPNTGFSFIWFRSGVTQTSGSGTVDSNGNYTTGNVASLSPAGSWTLQVTFSGSGNVITRSISVFENLSISPSSVARNQGFTVTASGGVPNSGFSFTWRRSGTTILSASGTLDSGGNFSAGGSFPDAGFYILTVTFSSTGNSASATVNVT